MPQGSHALRLVGRGCWEFSLQAPQYYSRRQARPANLLLLTLGVHVSITLDIAHGLIMAYLGTTHPKTLWFIGSSAFSFLKLPYLRGEYSFKPKSCCGTAKKVEPSTGFVRIGLWRLQPKGATHLSAHPGCGSLQFCCCAVSWCCEMQLLWALWTD